MARTQPAHVTEVEFLALPESMDHIELIDGQVILSPAPTVDHQETLIRVAIALRQWAGVQSEPHYVGLSPLDIRFAAERILQPDVFVLRGPRPRGHKGPLDIVPFLCVEVLSGNRVYDRVAKRFVYSAAAVEEYWTVDPGGVFERWTGPGLQTREVVTERLTSPRLPGFELDVAALFED